MAIGIDPSTSEIVEDAGTVSDRDISDIEGVSMAPATEDSGVNGCALEVEGNSNSEGESVYGATGAYWAAGP